MKENEMIHTSRVLIVEGKYDAARLSHLTDAMILLTDGFGIYSDKKRQQLFKALAQKNGLILLTDSDAAASASAPTSPIWWEKRMWFRLTCPRSTARKSARSSPARRACWGSRVWTMPLFYGRWRDALGAEAGAAAARPEGRQITYTDLLRSGGFPAGRAAPSARQSF